MPNVRSTRYYENFDMPKQEEQPQAAPEQPAGEAATPQTPAREASEASERPQVQPRRPAEADESMQTQAEQIASPIAQTETAEPMPVKRNTPSPENDGAEPMSAESARPRGELVYDVSNDDFAAESSQGEILVQALTARGTRPVPEAAVIIYKNRDGANKVVSFYLTDADGRTPNIPVPAPPKADSQSPSDTLPFADYNIAVRHPMYYTAMIDNVQVFGDELTIQTVDLIPLPEFVNERDTTKTVVIPKQNL